MPFRAMKNRLAVKADQINVRNAEGEFAAKFFDRKRVPFGESVLGIAKLA